MDENCIGTPLFHRTMQWAKENDNELTVEVWKDTPWMVEAYTGSMGSDDDIHVEIMRWCREGFGQEAWPIHKRPGTWRRGGATVDGWTWFGFATKEMLEIFSGRWQVKAESTT